MSNKSPKENNKSPMFSETVSPGYSMFSNDSTEAILPDVDLTDENVVMDFDSKMRFYIRTKNTESLSTAELRFEPFAFLIDEEGFLMDVVSSAQPESYVWKDYDPSKDKKKPEPTPAIRVKDTTSDTFVNHEVYVKFDDLQEEAKFLFVLLNSTTGYGSYSKPGVEITNFIRRNDKLVYKQTYAENIIKGSHSSMVLGVFTKNEDIWQFTKIDSKFNWDYIHEGLQKLHTELVSRKMITAKECKEAQQYICDKFKLRGSHEIQLKSSSIKLDFIGIPIGFDFDIDLACVLYNDHGHIHNYLYLEKDQEERKSVSILGSTQEGCKSTATIDTKNISLLKDKDGHSIRYLVFILTVYENEKYNFLWLKKNSVIVRDEFSGEKICDIEFGKNYKNALISLMIYKNDLDKWMLKVIDKPSYASSYVDTLDQIYFDGLIPKKNIYGSTELSEGKVSDSFNIKDFTGIRLIHHNYKKEFFDKLHLIFFDKEGYVIKFLDTQELTFQQKKEDCLDQELNFKDLLKSDDINNTSAIIGVLTATLSPECDLTLGYLIKNKRFCQMKLDTSLFDDEIPDGDHCSIITFQLLRSELDSSKWVILPLYACTSKNAPVRWFSLMREYLDKNLLSKRPKPITLLGSEEYFEKEFDDMNKITIGVSSAEGSKVHVNLTGYDYNFTELKESNLNSTNINDFIKKTINWDEITQNRNPQKFYPTDYKTTFQYFKEDDIPWYVRRAKGDSTSLIKDENYIPGEGDFSQITIFDLNNKFPYRMLNFGIYLDKSKNDQNDFEDEILIKIYDTESRHTRFEFRLTLEDDENWETRIREINATGPEEDSIRRQQKISSTIIKSNSTNPFIVFSLLRVLDDSGAPTGWKVISRCTDLQSIYQTVQSQEKPNQLHIIAKEGKNLLDCDEKNVSDPYLTVETDPPPKKAPEYKSKVCDKTLNPIWNDTIILPLEKKEKKGIVVHCWDDDGGKFVALNDRDKMGFINLKFTDCVPLPDGEYHKFYLMGPGSPAPGINMKGPRDARGYILLNFRYLNQDFIKNDDSKQNSEKSMGDKRKSLGKPGFNLFKNQK
eukprot:gene155-4401_t